MSKKKEKNATYEIIRKMRGDLGNVNPITKIIPNKKKNPKVKHKNKQYEE